MASAFEENVFINCPFDEDFRQLLLGIVFTVKYFGYNPKLSTERADSGESRIDKITKLIKDSKFGIHDLSRMVSSGTDEPYRMNMPFELGIDYGCQKLKGGKWSGKKILILEEERYRYQIALSDLSGSDIKSHDNDVSKAILAVRNWLVVEELNRGDSGDVVWDWYNEFNAYLYDQIVEEDGHASVDAIEIPEVIHHMEEWLSMDGW